MSKDQETAGNSAQSKQVQVERAVRYKGNVTTKEHKTQLRHSCGCTREVITLGYKIPNRQLQVMRTIPCPACQLKQLLLQST